MPADPTAALTALLAQWREDVGRDPALAVIGEISMPEARYTALCDAVEALQKSYERRGDSGHACRTSIGRGMMNYTKAVCEGCKVEAEVDAALSRLVALGREEGK